MPFPSADPLAPPPRSTHEVLASYEQLRQSRQARLNQLLTWQRRALVGLAGVVVIILIQATVAVHGASPAWPMLLSFAAAALLIVLLLRLQPRMTRARRLVAFYEESMLRADGTQPHTPHRGDDAVEPGGAPHLYERDLDITGANSIFSLLATMRTGIGQRGLAKYLLERVPYEESVLRQQSVRELLPQTELRERIALLGQSSFQQLSVAFFDRWLAEAAPGFHPLFRYALGATAAVNAGIILAGLFGFASWSVLWQNLLLMLGLQGGISLLMRTRAAPLLQGSARLQGQIKLLAEGLDLLQTTGFDAAKLLALQESSRQPAASVRLIRQLDGYLVIAEQRSKELFFVFSLLFAAGSQTAISIARWKRQNAAAMRLWLTVWAEFETLNALATYAYEHPADDVSYTWPELLPPAHPPHFAARELAHPLLAESVRNSVTLGSAAEAPAHVANLPQSATRFLLISGSNMAGKSTLLRSIGVSAALAYAGAPVRAASLRLTPLAVGASIALTDSLAEGKSKFLAEVERLAAIVTLSASMPVLFLVDEIFSGTNSLDRRTAAEAVLSRLLQHRAIGALSTHDLALTSLATESNGGVNVHMASPDAADPLGFDYILKPGVNHQSNALAIIRLMGLDA